MNTRKRVGIVAWLGRLLLPALLLVGAEAATAAEPSTDLIAAAKKEGVVVVYISTVSPVYQEIAAAFEKRYGIKVQYLEARASEIAERIRTEQAAGKPLADLIYTGLTSMAILKRDNVLEPFGDVPNVRNIGDFFSKDERSPERDDMIVPIHAATWAVLVNTALVKPGDEPRSWLDLLDEKWRGKILMDDPRALGGGNVFFNATFDAFGRSFHEKLAAQKPTLSREVMVSPQRVARGEYAVYAPMNAANYLRMRGLPVKMITLKEGNPYIVVGLGLLKKAPHPNAARLLMNYFLEEESQLKYPHNGWRNVVTAIDGKIPDDRKMFVEPRLLGKTPSPERAEELLAIAGGIYK